ncbi:MAG: hypothetical protein HS108_00160 [Planctomycetes bacterium]|jgi:ribosomal protein S27E|nr:hypothetical protein [Planctomycetota bacterium]MCL4730617.1 hypothetical protein [Planctomycetota bacterium]
MSKRMTAPLLLRVTLRELPMPVRCPCGALLMRVYGPAQIEVKCRRCGRLLELRAA